VSRARSGRAAVRADAWGLALAVVLGSAAVARAEQQQPVGTPSPSASIEIVVVGSPDAFERLHALLDRRLSALGTATWSRAERVDAGEILAAPPGQALRCWIDLRERRRARLYFAARSGERFLVRDFELSGDLDEIDRAAMAEVIELSIGALLEDARAGLSRGEAQALLARRAARAPAAPPANQAPAQAAVERSPLAGSSSLVRQPRRLELGVFYAAEAVAASLPIDNGPGVSLAVSQEIGAEERGPRLFAAGWITAQVLLPETVTGSVASVGRDAVAARAGIELGLRRWRARLGAGWDFVHVSPTTTNPSVTLAAPHWTETFACQGAVRLEVARIAASRLWVSLRGDLSPAAVDYGVAVGGNFRSVFSPWRVRPGLGFEVSFP
jgi:hypothetical protein